MLWDYFGIPPPTGIPAANDDDAYTSYAIDDDAYHYFHSPSTSYINPSSSSNANHSTSRNTNNDDDDDDTTQYDDPDYFLNCPDSSSPSAPSSPTARSIAIKITSTITRPLVNALKNNIPGVAPLSDSPSDGSSGSQSSSLSSSPDTQTTFASQSSSPTLAGDVETDGHNSLGLGLSTEPLHKSTTSKVDEDDHDSYWAMYNSVGGTADSTIPSPPPEQRRILKPATHSLLFSTNSHEDYDAFGNAIPVSTFDDVVLDRHAADPTQDFIRRVEEERSERWSSPSLSDSSGSLSESTKNSRSRSTQASPFKSHREEEQVQDAEFDKDPFGRGFEDAFGHSEQHDDEEEDPLLAPAAAEIVQPLDSLGLSLGPENPTQATTTTGPDTSREEDLAREIRGIYNKWIATVRTSTSDSSSLSSKQDSEESFVAFVRQSLTSSSHHL